MRFCSNRKFLIQKQFRMEKRKEIFALKNHALQLAEAQLSSRNEHKPAEQSSFQ